MKTSFSEPTSEQCSAHAKVTGRVNGVEVIGFACWYPQMGGYAGHAVLLPLSGCFEVLVWHNGEFPFSEEDGSPAYLHHCDADQFIAFGEFAKSVTPESEEANG
jgi:hypothetical protein